MEGQRFIVSDKGEGTESVVEGFSPKNPDLPWRRPRCNIAKLVHVWDGSAGEVPPGYWLCSVLEAEVHGSELTPLYQQLFSVRAQDFVSENDELLSAIERSLAA